MTKKITTVALIVRVVVFGAAVFLFQANSALATDTDWPVHGLDAQETRFSPLTQINRETVSRLGLAWEFDDFIVRGRTHRGMEATPLVVDGTIFFTGPWSVVYALDAITGAEKWRYDPGVPGAWVRKACCDAINRGVAFKAGRIFVGTLDGFLVALDIKSGAVVWRIDTLIDRTRAYTITGAPRIAGDLILIGNGGGELGVRGYVSAYHIDSGALAWRFFTVPEKDPPADENTALKLAAKTWAADTKWEFGLGGTVWDSMVHDAALGLVYIGVGNGSPWPAWSRSPGGGDHLYLSSILALEAETGALRWHYQTTPGDSWDYTATQHMILTDLEVAGVQRKVLLQAPKNGFFYVIDRETGELLSAEPYTRVTWATHVDQKTGRPVPNPQADYRNGARIVEPSIAGGHNWQPMSLSGKSGLVYIPVLEGPMEFSMYGPEAFRPDSIVLDVRVNDKPRRGDVDPMLGIYQNAGPTSRLKAWNPKTNALAWQTRPMPWWGGGVLSTAGGLVFQGGMDGVLRAYDAADGTLIAALEIGTPIMAPPVTYQLGGVQYLAVLAGFGGSVKAYPPGSAALKYENAERALVFRLGGAPVQLPPKRTPAALQPAHPQSAFDRKSVARGKQIFLDNCGRCHAFRGVPNGYPNLWNLPPGLYDALAPIVLEGSMEEAGMPSFSDVLDKADVDDIREFLLADEAKSRTANTHGQ